MGLKGFKLNSAGFLDVFDQWARNDGEARIDRTLAEAQANAPVKSGEYRNGLHKELVVHNGRPVWRVVGGSDHDLIVEADTGNLARALDAGR